MGRKAMTGSRRTPRDTSAHGGRRRYRAHSTMRIFAYKTCRLQRRIPPRLFAAMYAWRYLQTTFLQCLLLLPPRGTRMYAALAPPPHRAAWRKGTMTRTASLPRRLAPRIIFVTSNDAARH